MIADCGTASSRRRTAFSFWVRRTARTISTLPSSAACRSVSLWGSPISSNASRSSRSCVSFLILSSQPPATVIHHPNSSLTTLSQMLRDTPLTPGLPLRLLAQRAVGLSGSDLRELCRNAAMIPVQEYVRRAGVDGEMLARGQLEVSRRHYFSLVASYRELWSSTYWQSLHLTGLHPPPALDWRLLRGRRRERASRTVEW